MPHTKSLSVLLLPKTPSIDWVNDSDVDSDLQIRHSHSDPVIHPSNTSCRVLVESPRQDQQQQQEESESEIQQTDTNLLHPHWLSTSSVSIASMESTISADEVIYDVITIEGLRTLYSSCFKCGVNWHQDHITLDCVECGGYAMQRPCPVCDGQCNSVWRRNLTMTHNSRKANWEGECKSATSNKKNLSVKEVTTNPLQSPSSSHQQLLATLKV